MFFPLDQQELHEMNILLVSAGLPDKRSGGLPAYLSEVIEELLARGHRIYYLDTSGRSNEHKGIYHETTTRADGLVITRFYNLKLFPDYGRGTMDPLAQVRPDPAFQRHFDQWLANVTVDIVHVHEFIGFPAEALSSFFRRHIPVMATMHDYYALCPTVKLMLPDGHPCIRGASDLVCRRCCRHGDSRVQLKLGNLIQRISGYRGGSWLAGVVWPRIAPLVREAIWRGTTAKAYRMRREILLSVLQHLDLIFGISHLAADLYRQIGGLENVAADTTYIRKTVRHEAPVRSASRKTGRPLRILVLNVRRMHKGLDLLRYELAQLGPKAERNFRLLAWGCSHIESPLVDNKGPYDGGQLDSLCAEADIGLVPSVWREAFGFVGAEMLSRGLPVIASHTGAMKEYITHGEDGLLFDPFKPGDLASVLKRLADDNALIERLSNGALEGWKKFNTFEDHIEKLVCQYEKLIVEKRRSQSTLLLSATVT
jgi:glycosyltransferase involved in cell wall biosynthesis